MFQHALFMHPSALLPMSTKHQHIFYLFKLAHPERERRAAFFFFFSQCLSLSLSSGIVGQSAKHSRFGCNHLQLKFNEMETDTEFFFFFSFRGRRSNAPKHTLPSTPPGAVSIGSFWSVCLTASCFFLKAALCPPPKKKSRPDPHTCTPRSCAHIPAHARQHAAHDLPPPPPPLPAPASVVKSSTVYRLDFYSETAADRRKRSLNKNLFSSIKKQGAICSSAGGGESRKQRVLN